MAETMAAALRVALIADDGEQRDRLRELLVSHELEVVYESALSALNDGVPDGTDAQVILIDLVEEPDLVGLENLIEVAPAPILFSESSLSTGRRWGEKLVQKLTALVRTAAEKTLQAPEPAPEPPAPSRPALKVVVGGDTLPQADVPATRLCVLGASIGGPDALKQFLGALPADIGSAFLVAQHIGAGFDHRLAEQLNRMAAVEVRLARDGDLLRHGLALVVPTGGRMELDGEARVHLTGDVWSGPYNPTINDVLTAAAERFGDRAGAILFSGMGDDGAAGAVQIADAGGFVWAQDEASCVISSIPDSARRRGVVDYSGTPAKLAQRLRGVCAAPVAAVKPDTVGA